MHSKALDVLSFDLKLTRPSSARIMIAQANWSMDQLVEREGLYFHSDFNNAWNWFEKVLDHAQRSSVKLVVLPELSVPEEFLQYALDWSKKTESILIAGSHYFKKDTGYIARCPIFYNGETFYTEKIIPAPQEVSPIQGQGLQPGAQLLVIENSLVGNLAVLICSDYLDLATKQSLPVDKLDLLCVPAFQRDSNIYHRRMSNDCEDWREGAYIVYANTICEGHGDGRSAIFAVIDKLYLPKFKQAGLTDGNPEWKLCELKTSETYMIAYIDLQHKLPSAKRNVRTRPNVIIVEPQMTTKLEAYSSPLVATSSGHSKLPGEIKFVHSVSLPLNWASRNKVIDEIAVFLLDKENRLILVRGITGSGKTSVVKKLIEELHEKNISFEKLLWFSFYLQDDADHFLAEACEYFIPGFDATQHPSPFDKSLRLREALSKTSCLIVLDGIEAVLEKERESPRHQRFKDRALKDFLLGICSDQSGTKLVATSTLPILELDGERGYKDYLLPPLQTPDAVNYMLAAGVKGDHKKIGDVCERFGNHPMTLRVMASHLTKPPKDGNIEGVGKLAKIPSDTPQAKKLNAILQNLRTQMSKSEWYFISRLALFRFGAKESELLFLAGDEEGNLCDINNPIFLETLHQLISGTALVNVGYAQDSKIYILHPLIREFVRESLSNEEKDTIYLGLVEYAKKAQFPEDPSSLQDLQPHFDLFYYLINLRQYERAYSILTAKIGVEKLRQPLFTKLFWWGHYSIAYDFFLSPLITAYQRQQWKPIAEKISYIYKQAGNIVAKAHSTKEAEKLYRIAIETAGSNAMTMASPIQQYLCELYCEAGKYYQALEVLREIKGMLVSLGVETESFRIVGREGYINAGLGNVVEAKYQLSKSIELAGDAKYGDPGYLCLFLRIRGDLEVYIEDYARAWQDYNQGLKLARDPVNYHIDYEGHILKGIANIHLKQNDYKEATKLYRDALSIAKNTGSQWLEIEVRSAIANLLLLNGEKEAAVQEATQIIEIAEAGEWLVTQINSLIILAQAKINDGDLLKANDFLSRAETIWRQSGCFWSMVSISAIKEELLEGR